MSRKYLKPGQEPLIYPCPECRMTPKLTQVSKNWQFKDFHIPGCTFKFYKASRFDKELVSWWNDAVHEYLRAKSVEQIIRDILSLSIKHGLVNKNKYHDVESVSAGDLVGPANLLADYLHAQSKLQSAEQSL